ncbi:MAG: phage virion morphogenesis protein [Mucilaginibacter sp.]
MPNNNIPDIFARLRTKIEAALAELPEVIGNEGVNYTLEAFEAQGWEGVPWQERENKKDAGRAILDKSGALRRSIQIIRYTPSSVIWGSAGIIYAQVHNDGLTINRPARSETFTRPRFLKGPNKGSFRKIRKDELRAAPKQGQSYKAHSITMPRRTFIRFTPELKQRLINVAKTELSKAIKS